DQSSFILYYKEKLLLIAPGYRPSWDSYNIGKEWLYSPYSHNLIMVNPYHEDYGTMSYQNWYFDEQSELSMDYWHAVDFYNTYSVTLAQYWNDWRPDYGSPPFPEDPEWIDLGNPNNYKFKGDGFEPIGPQGGRYGVDHKNPAYKNYLICNEYIQHLKINIVYDHPQGDVIYPGNINDTISIARNFYSLDIEDENPYFIVYDTVGSSIHNSENEFMNQLHFALYPTSENTYYSGCDNLSNNSGIFTHHSGCLNETYLHGIMGSENNAEWTIRDSLPQGLYFNSSRKWGDNCPPPQWEHKALRVNTTTTGDEQFLTLLIPSESSTNPIDSDYIVNGNGYYGAKFDMDVSDSYCCYTGIKSENINYIVFGSQSQVLVETNAEFFLIETDSLFTDYKKIVLNGGNELELQNNISVFNSTISFEEMIASYENNELHVSFKSDNAHYPKYKILRCGIKPENFYSSTEYGSYSANNGQSSTRETIEDNIYNLAYDNEYFYVNYSYPELIDGGIVSDSLVFFIGSYPSSIFTTNGYPNKLRFAGQAQLSGTYAIADSFELVFEPGAQPLLAYGTSFNIHGTVTANGSTNDHILFTTNSDWGGFYIYSDGEAEFNYCEFEYAYQPVRCLGAIEIENCEISDCENGLYLQGCASFVVNENNIHDCNAAGLLISNIFFCMSPSSIWNNEIYENSYGLYLFNTGATIDSCFIHDNVSYNILATSGTSSIIKECCIQDAQSNHPEIYLVSASYPVISKRNNDIIFGSGYSIYNADGETSSYKCGGNYWGTTNSNMIEESFYPANWIVDYDPISTSPNTGFNGESRELSIFEMGMAAEEAGYLQVAREYYLQCIEESPDNSDGLGAASRLMNCVESENGFSYYDAQQIYETLSSDTVNVVLRNLAKKYDVNCDRKNQDFQEAIVKYEDMLADSISCLDSILVQLNIVHTYLEAESVFGRTALCFKEQRNAIENHKQAIDKESDLLNMLIQETDPSSSVPIPDHAVLYHNYPNPFNPTTTISFSIPEESKVGIEIYNIKGQKVKQLVDEQLTEGIHSVIWDGKNDSSKSVSSGVYFYKLKVNGKDKAIKKCLLLK
ncbi:MAG TPA: T9SS type A sorting domain-containing protein, partial [Candidatus Cloacimonadota bacterium]|nr:T9SS type A sorting domain-containing protein [Candidatus Cloacimonadota bacterium]